jgi:hypothetical protein
MTITKTSVEECALVPEFYLGNAIIRCSMKDKYIGECLKFSISPSSFKCSIEVGTLRFRPGRASAECPNCLENI